MADNQDYQSQINDYLAFKGQRPDHKPHTPSNDQGPTFGRPKRGRGGRFRGNGGFNRNKPSTSKFGSKGPTVARCELCDKNFSSYDLYETHISEHAKCPAQNCKFEAHYMIVEQHFNNLHTLKPGQKQNPEMTKLWSVETPEEIEKWRENRRKKFPKMENSIKASEEREAKMVRAREMKGEKQIRLLEKAAALNEQRMKRKREQEEKLEKSVEDQVKKISDPKTTNTSTTTNTNDVTRTATNEPEAESSEAKKPKKQKSLKNSQNPQNDTKTNHDIPDRFKHDQDSKFLWPPQPGMLANGTPHKDHLSTREDSIPSSLYSKNSLLTKLLSAEVARERNLLIQCVEHTVRNDFYKPPPAPVAVYPELTNLNGGSSASASDNSSSGSSSSDSDNDSPSTFDSSEISRDIEVADGPDDENLLAILASYLN